MAGMEGGVGGPPLDWRSFWRWMLGLAIFLIAAVSFGEWIGWLN